METKKNIGIWMDHANAHVMEFTTDFIEANIISSKFTHVESEHDIEKSEYHMHNKEQHQQSAYYKKLGEVIKDCKEVVLFGPTDAKTELLNVLRADNRFEKIKIEVKKTDKMTDNQQHAFVKDYFQTHKY